MKTRLLIILTLVGFLSLISFISHYAYAYSTIEEYCKYSVKNQLPTPWDYYCYDDPLNNPAREMDLGKSAIIDDYTNCDTRDSVMDCFEYSLKTCRPSTSDQTFHTGEGDPIYYEVFLKEDCTIHIIINNQRDMHSSSENRGIFHTVCPQLEWRDNFISIDSCEELERFNDYYELFHINKEKSDAELIQEIWDYCNYDGSSGQFSYGLEFRNETHFLDNNNCKWVIEIDPYEFDESLPDCRSGTELRDGVCTVIDGGCEPDIDGNTFWCDPVEDALTLERFLFEPPIINEQPTFPMILIFLTIPLFIGIYWWKKHE